VVRDFVVGEDAPTALLAEEIPGCSFERGSVSYIRYYLGREKRKVSTGTDS